MDVVPKGERLMQLVCKLHVMSWNCTQSREDRVRESGAKERERERVEDERETEKKDKLLLKCARTSFGLCFGPETLHWPKCKSPSPIFGAA